MAQLPYRGADLSVSNDLAYRPYPASLKSGDLTTGQVNSQIDSLLSGYVAASYAQDQDAFLATPEFVDAGDAERIPLAYRAAPNGVAPLDNSGKIPTSYFPIPSTQRWNVGPWTPPSYLASSSSVTTTETLLYTCPVSDPGGSYKLMVFGQVDGTVGGDDLYPVINVRVGAVDGTIIAKGQGAADGPPSVKYGDDFQRANSNSLGEGWNVTYTGEGNTEVTILTGEAFMPQATSPQNFHRVAICQRVDPDTRYTGTNYQMVQLTTGTLLGGQLNSTDGRPYFRIYLRCNDDMTQYVAWEVINNEARLMYNKGSGEDLQIGESVETDWNMNTNWYGYAGGSRSGLAERVFSLYKENTLISQVADVTGLTSLGPENRGWGFGLKNTLWLLGQLCAPSIESIYVTDLGPPYEPTQIVPYNLHDGATTLTGATTLYVTAQRSNTSLHAYTASAYRPQLYVQALPV